MQANSSQRSRCGDWPKVNFLIVFEMNQDVSAKAQLVDRQPTRNGGLREIRPKAKSY